MTDKAYKGSEMRVYKDNRRIPIKSWCENTDENTIEQATELTKLPFIYKHIALMPDTHFGYKMPIGGVVATENVILPFSVGFDIGCGIVSLKTNIKVSELTQDVRVDIDAEIRKRIPVGFVKRSKPKFIMPEGYHLEMPVVVAQFKNAELQLGTLGSGNHYVELQEDKDGSVWIMIHSGSRNLGHKIASFYENMASDINKEWFSVGDGEYPFFPIDSDVGRAYIEEMNYALEYAKVNRESMLCDVIESLQVVLSNKYNNVEAIVGDNKRLDIHHNYARMESHFGKNLMVHRKGAISAREGEYGIISGSQGTPSYIVIGKGNKLSFTSASHGAGRRLGRKQAIKELDMEKELESLKGKFHTLTSVDKLDEAPGAYKDIGVVMEEQKELVDIVEELIPVLTIKG